MSLSPFTDVKSRGRESLVAVEQLEMAEEVTSRTAQRLAGQRGELIAEIGLEEVAEADAGALEPVAAVAQAALVADATDDKEGVVVIGREEGPGGLDAGVTGLHHLLRVGQIVANENVEIGRLGYLQERHDDLRWEWDDCVRRDSNPHDTRF
jgi:hypothetical protein